MRKKKNNVNGWIFLDKPSGKSSNNVLQEIKKKFNPEKLGFVGTLDPLASGFLPIAFGKATKTIKYIEKSEKEYFFTVNWGKKTSTGDKEGEIIKTTYVLPEKRNIIQAVKKVEKTKLQVPHKFSAKKINGKRAYELARKGKNFKLTAQQINISKLDIIELEKYFGSFYAKVSSGTYIRSLAESLSEELGTYGYVCTLRRVGFGNLDKKLISLDFLLSLMHIDKLISILNPLDCIFEDENRLDLKYEDVKKLLNGIPVNIEEIHKKSFFLDSSLKSRIIAKYKDDLMVIGNLENNIFYPKTVMDLRD